MSRTINLGKIVPERGTDYWTAQDKAEIISTATTNVENNFASTIATIQSNSNNALNTANTANSTANTAKSIAEGANQALSYANYQAMITAFNSLADDVYRIGQNVMIVTLNVPDLWISEIEQTSEAYTYTTDEAFTTLLQTNGYVKVGYYRLSPLETQKVDLTDYYTKEDTDSKISEMISVDDVQINGTSIVSNGVANIPPAGTDTFGVAKINVSNGVRILNNGQLATYPAVSSHVKTGTDESRPLVPKLQHESTFYGLAKASGDTTQAQSSNPVGTYTSEAKTAICTMLGVYDAIDANITRTEFEELKQENEDLKKNQLTNTPEISTSHYLQDSADARFRKFIPIGRTTQESTTGKNLAGLIDETYSNNNVTVIVNNGKVTINGTPSSTTFFSIATNLNLISGDYVLYAFNSSTIGNSSTSGDYADIRLTDERGGNYGNYVLLGTKNNKIGISLSNDDSSAKIVLRLGANLQFNNFVITPMLIKGTSTTEPYEPYTGGEPAPNPKYPFPIKNTGDSGSVNESVSNSDNTESQTISFPLAQGQKLYEGDYLADDGIHSLWNEDTVNGTTSTFSDAKINGAYYCNQKVSGNLTGQTITFDTSVTNAIVQYELAQEQVIPFTQEQQQAWEQIKALRTYKNVTHISSEDETPANVEIEYVQDTKTYIDNKVTALTNAITSLGGNV